MFDHVLSGYSKQFNSVHDVSPSLKSTIELQIILSTLCMYHAVSTNRGALSCKAYSAKVRKDSGTNPGTILLQ